MIMSNSRELIINYILYIITMQIIEEYASIRVCNDMAQKFILSDKRSYKTACPINTIFVFRNIFMQQNKREEGKQKCVICR